MGGGIIGGGGKIRWDTGWSNDANWILDPTSDIQHPKMLASFDNDVGTCSTFSMLNDVGIVYPTMLGVKNFIRIQFVTEKIFL